jgi:hypothetical protein
MSVETGSTPGAGELSWGERPFRIAFPGGEFTVAMHDVFIAFTLLLRLLMGWILLWAGFR